MTPNRITHVNGQHHHHYHHHHRYHRYHRNLIQTSNTNFQLPNIIISQAVHYLLLYCLCLTLRPLDASSDLLLKSSDIISIFNYPQVDIHHLHTTGSSYLSEVTTIENEGEDWPSSNLCDKDHNGIMALGMESEQIPDSALTASSAFEMLHVGPQNARLNKDKSGGAWCPSKQLGPDTSGTEWIQVDLGKPHVVTGVATQGRYGKGLGQEFTEWYNVLYSRQITPTKWIKWKSLDGRSNLEGNIDPNTVEEHHLELPLVGVRHIRIVPLSNHTRTVCLRFELFGCLYQGPISYTLPADTHEAVVKANHPELLDLSYDGSLSDETGSWFGGLGQLTDGIKPVRSKSSEYIWVGWPRIKNETTSLLKLFFEFDQVYNFTSLSLNCRNNFNHNIRAFSNALVWFSIDNEHWSHSAISFEYQADHMIESPRDITIPLQYRIGQFIRIELIYHSEWLQISEISFDCHPLPSNLTRDQKSKLFEWTHSAAYNAASAGGTRYVMSEDNVLQHNNHSSNFVNSNSVGDDSEDQTLKYSLIIACLCTLGLVIVSLLVSFVLKRLNLRKNNVFTEISDGELESENAAINMKNLPKGGSPLYCNPKEICSLHEEAEYAIPDVIYPSNLSKTLHLHSNNNNNNSNIKTTPTGQTTNSIVCKTLQINPRFYASSDLIYPKQNIYGTRLGKPIRNLLEVEDFSVRNNQIQANNPNNQQTPLLDTFNQTNMVTSGTGRLFHSGFYNDIINGGNYGIRIYSESEIGVVQSLGKSKYGDVLLCNIPVTGKHRLVIVRTVNDLSLKNEFIKSMDYMRKLSEHREEFARLLGIIDTPTYFASIIEHGDCDLNYFLRKSNSNIISFEALLYIARQIANGCIYLESIKQTHQDIATRNIIVYEKNLLVRITDGAAFLNKYSMDYYNGLPIRWMSPESIVRNEYTTESEIYSFGVCFWEILTYAKSRPFAELSDEEFLSAIYSYMNNGEETMMIHLTKPPQCSKEIYELVQECCDPNETQRPTFKEISLFLQRKTLAFSKPISSTKLLH